MKAGGDHIVLPSYRLRRRDGGGFNPAVVAFDGVGNGVLTAHRLGSRSGMLGEFRRFRAPAAASMWRIIAVLLRVGVGGRSWLASAGRSPPPSHSDHTDGTLSVHTSARRPPTEIWRNGQQAFADPVESANRFQACSDSSCARLPSMKCRVQHDDAPTQDRNRTLTRIAGSAVRFRSCVGASSCWTRFPLCSAAGHDEFGQLPALKTMLSVVPLSEVFLYGIRISEPVTRRFLQISVGGRRVPQGVLPINMRP